MKLYSVILGIRLSRRNTGIIAAVAGGAAIVGGIGFLANKQPSSLQEVPSPVESTPQLRPTDAFLAEIDAKILDPKAIIQNEVKRLKIQADTDEPSRWAAFSSPAQQVSLTEILADSAKKQQINNTIYNVLQLMKDSNNPYFKKAYEDILNAENNGDLKFSVDPNLYTDDPKDFTYALTRNGIDRQNNKFLWQIALNPYDIYNNADGIIIACTLAHENQHLQDGIAHQKLLSSLATPDERQAFEVAKSRNIQEVTIEEAYGLGTGNQAYIYETGLMGFDLNNGSIPRKVLERYAAAFIVTGSNPESPDWREFVQKDYLPSAPVTPKG